MKPLAASSVVLFPVQRVDPVIQVLLQPAVEPCIEEEEIHQLQQVHRVVTAPRRPAEAWRAGRQNSEAVGGNWPSGLSPRRSRSPRNQPGPAERHRSEGARRPYTISARPSKGILGVRLAGRAEQHRRLQACFFGIFQWFLWDCRLHKCNAAGEHEGLGEPIFMARLMVGVMSAARMSPFWRAAPE